MLNIILRPEISGGELKISLWLLVPLLPCLAALYTLVTYTVIHESEGERICSIPQHNHSNTWERDHVTFQPPELETYQKHPGCSVEPVYTSRKSCPNCFRPTVIKEFSDDQFRAIPFNSYLSPRGPRDVFQPATTRQQNFVSGILITPQGMCVDVCPYLVALVLSLLHEKKTRNSIRQTWASVAKSHHWPGGARLNGRVAVIFVIAWSRKYYGPKGSGHGGVGLNDNEKRHDLNYLQNEARVNNDILMLDMIDTYSNLTLKVASGLSWAYEHCSRSKFFLKIDQDTFLNMPLLLDLLIYHERRLQTAVVGHVFTQYQTVVRKGRWGVSKSVYPMSKYPVYTAGCAYVLSRQAAYRMLSLFPYFSPLGIEDAFLTGVLGRAAGVSHFSSNHRHYFTEFFHRISDWCSFLTDGLVTGTRVTTEGHRLNIWASYIANDWQCPKGVLTEHNAPCWEEFGSRITV